MIRTLQIDLKYCLFCTHTASQLCYSALFVAQVADFIIKNTNVDTSAFANAGVADPFTGTSVGLCGSVEHLTVMM